MKLGYGGNNWFRNTEGQCFWRETRHVTGKNPLRRLKKKDLDLTGCYLVQDEVRTTDMLFQKALKTEHVIEGEGSSAILLLDSGSKRYHRKPHFPVHRGRFVINAGPFRYAHWHVHCKPRLLVRCIHPCTWRPCQEGKHNPDRRVFRKHLQNVLATVL